MTALKFYCPHYIELLFDFFGEFDISTNDRYTPEKKRKVLNTVSELLSNKIIYIGNIENKKIKRWSLSNEDILKKIDVLWHERTDFEEFYDMVWFGYENWYIEKLEQIGLSNNIDWKIFVETKIGDLEKWIEQNKPK